MTLVYTRRLSDDVSHTILGYHGVGYITNMQPYIVRTDKDNENTQTIGLEIEVSRGSKPITQNMIDKIMEIFPYCQLSNDVSIPGSHTFEMQTAPMTYNAYLESGFKEMLQYLRDHDFKASAVTDFDTGCGCGGHIHISKGDKWEDVVALMAMFLDQNKEIVQIICRRPFTSYAYNNLRDLHKSVKRYSLTGVKEYMMSRAYEHSAMLNLQHNKTIEFRLPIGTINFDTKMAHIEFITNLYKCCEDVIKGNARIDRLTINKVCQDGQYLPKLMRELCISCSKHLVVYDNEIKKRTRQLQADKLKLVKILSDLQYELGTTCDNEIRQGSINTISNRFTEITTAETTEQLIIYIKRMKDADTISDGLEEYSRNHNNNISKYYTQLKNYISNVNVDNIYYDVIEEI